MSARLLALVMPDQEPAALDALGALAATARAERARLRFACLRPLPPPRVDRYGRTVADVDREMERITRTTVERFTTAARVFDDVDVECVVRFGTPVDEARLEKEAFAPDLIASFESRRESVTIRLRTRLRRSLDSVKRRRWASV
jgi:nucleotide-binding universal stress UspA family protein